MLEGAVAEARAQVAAAIAAAQSRGSNAAALMDAAAADSRLTAVAAATGEVGDLQQGAAAAEAGGAPAYSMVMTTFSVISLGWVSPACQELFACFVMHRNVPALLLRLLVIP